MHVQFNVIDKATLVEAQKHPEQHKDLVVRVAGYSAQFISLAKEVQDNIIDVRNLNFDVACQRKGTDDVENYH